MSKSEGKRFEVIYQQGSALTEMTLILRDKETGAQYLFVQCGYAAALRRSSTSWASRLSAVRGNDTGAGVVA